MKNSRIESIQKTIRFGEPKYEIILRPNYSFESTGNQIQYCSTIAELYELTNEIIYCDGDIIRRGWK